MVGLLEIEVKVC